MSNAGGGRIGRRKSAEACRSGVSVQAEERRHLIEACAFFRADHFRPAEPGAYRQQDLEDAAAEIDGVLKRGARKSGKR